MSAAPTLRVKGLAVAEDLFATGYAEGGGPCTCSSTCCSGGVYADVTERDAILGHADMIARYMDETQPRDPAQWFDTDEEDDPDFASGRCVGTQVHNDKCVFLDKYGRCSIQRATTEEGKGRWALKPLYCILYPIEISDGVVSFDPMLQDEQPCCTVSGEFQVPVFRACRDELTHLLGADGYEELERHYASHPVPQREANNGHA
jgi:Fe-S-cluster containining protein